MKNRTRIAVAAMALLSSVSVAAAASSMSKSTTTGSASATMAQPKDTMSLTTSEKKTAFGDISKAASKETPPAGFSAVIGAAVPSSLGTQPVPSSTADKVPALRPYSYALLDSNKLLIVNPKDNKVAEVITQ